jgi:hypothetical protein
MRPDPSIAARELGGKLLVTFTSSSGSSLGSINLLDHLELIGIDTLDKNTQIFTDTHFPPMAFLKTGRGPHDLSVYHACLGSGSAMFRWPDDSRTLSWVAFYDTSHHNGTREHFNVELWAWPKNVANPDWTNRIEVHMLYDNNVRVVMAEGTPVERTVVLQPPSGGSKP